MEFNDEPDIDDSDIDDSDDEITQPSKKIPKKITKIVKLGEEEEYDDDDDSDMESSSVKSSDNESDDDSDNESTGSVEQSAAELTSAKSILPAFPEFDESDEDEEEDDNYLQKFDETTKHNIISDFHPEMQAHNYEEVEVLSTTVRNENGIIVDPLHRTFPFITKYEKARILGERAKQLNSGAKAFVEVEPTVIDGYLIALKEFEQKKIPFILRRPLPNGGCEYWRLRDLEIL